MFHYAKKCRELRLPSAASLALSAPLLLVGCGGDSAKTPTSNLPIPSATQALTPAPSVPPQTSTPAQIAPIENFETQEYFNGVGLEQIGAATAYSYGASGEGVTVAVIDTNFLADHPELQGQLHARSIDLFANERASDEFDHTGHGTAVAAIIAGKKDGQGMHGVAYNASILGIRADRAGSCVFEGVAGNCGFRDDHLAQGIDYAIAQGAQIINISIGGKITADQTLEDAIGRAVNAGVLVVIAAGNEAKPAHIDDYGYARDAEGVSPNEPAYLAGLATSLGLVVAVGSVDLEGRISDFSNRAGEDSKAFYLLAPGEGIITAGPDDDIVQQGASENDSDGIGDYYRIEGTSFAAPYVAGSLALLLEAFPNLDGATALEILINTADDYIDPDADPVTGETAGIGVDAVGGAGIINLAEAFSPQGTTTVQINSKAVLTSALIAPAQGAFGDWASTSDAFGGQVFTDSYERAYNLPTHNLNPETDAPIADLEAQADWFNSTSKSVGIGDTQFHFTSINRETKPWEYQPVEDDIMLSAQFGFAGGTLQLGKGGAMAALAPRMRLTTSHNGSLTPSGNWSSFTQAVGQFNVQTFASQTDSKNLIGSAIGQNHGRLQWRAAFARTEETGTALGSQIQSRFGAGEDQSLSNVIGIEGQHTFGQNWHLSFGAEIGAVDLPRLDTKGIISSQFSFGLEKSFGGLGRFSARLNQPTRIETGTLSFTSATGVDASGALVIGTIDANLSPSGRTINLEGGWNFDIGEKWHGNLTALHMANPHHVAGADSARAIQFNIKRIW